MEILKKIRQKAEHLNDAPSVTIAFLGDSVTQGCFEVYMAGDRIKAVHDAGSSYPEYFGKLLGHLFPSVPFNIINAGISGDSAPSGLTRLMRDVVSHSPDLTVVCYGLNDCMQGVDGISKYAGALDAIIAALLEAGSEVIVMTPNSMNTNADRSLGYKFLDELAKETMKTQNDGILKMYLDTAAEIARGRGVKVCDCYKIWSQLGEAGTDTTLLLSNGINHPTREMNWLFASKLLGCIFED